jgi:hypothetical protein
MAVYTTNACRLCLLCWMLSHLAPWFIIHANVLSGRPRSYVRHTLTKARITSWFLGQYDNIEQASIDALAGRPTASSGGHEHVTAEFTRFCNQSSLDSDEIIG